MDDTLTCPHCNGSGEVPAKERKGRSVSARLALARANRYKVIHERNLILLWAISGRGCDDAHLIEVDKSNAWGHVLCVHTPQGEQLHWKLSPDDFETLQTQLRSVKNDHKGACTPEEKLTRLVGLGKARKASK